MTNERKWAAELDYLLTVLRSEVRSDPKAFYRQPANRISDTNGNERAKFMAEKMRAVLPHIEQLVRAN